MKKVVFMLVLLTTISYSFDCSRVGNVILENGWNLIGNSSKLNFDEFKKNCMSKVDFWVYEDEIWNKNKTDIKDGQGIWIKTQNIKTSNIITYSQNPITIDKNCKNFSDVVIKNGWNLLGGYEFSVSDIKSNCDVNEIWIYENSNWISNPYYVKSGQGFWLNVNEKVSTNFYKFESKTDEKGLANLNEILNFINLSDKNLNELYIEVVDKNGNPLKNVNIYYEIDTTDNSINIKAEDSNGEYTTLYQHKFLDSIEVVKNDKRFLSELIGIVKAVMTTINFYNKAKEIFNLDLDVNKKRNETNLFQGTIEELINYFDLHNYIDTTIFSLIKNFKVSDNYVSLANAITFKKDNFKSNLIEYLLKIGGYNLDLNTQIKANLYNFGNYNNKFNEVISLEIADNKNVKNSVSKEYNLKVLIEGKNNYPFDIDLFSQTPPDFKGTIIIKGENFKMVEKSNSYTNSATFKNVPISIGEKIYVTIIDKDLVSHDQIIDFSFEFDEKDHFEENNKAKVEVLFNKILLK